jgi:hypothetical protein
LSKRFDSPGAAETREKNNNEYFEIFLHNSEYYDILPARPDGAADCPGGAVSLVRSAVFEEGPKNPLKGIPVKPLVLALDAQFGVGAGGTLLYGACICRAIFNGMENPTLLMRRPVLVRRSSKFT